MRFLLLASILVHKTYLCDGSVALKTLSQGLASFNTQIIGADSDHCDTAVGLQAVGQDATTTCLQLAAFHSLHVDLCDGIVSYFLDRNSTERLEMRLLNDWNEDLANLLIQIIGSDVDLCT